MAQYFVWIDSSKAMIFNLKPAGIEKSHLDNASTVHENNHGHSDSATEHYYHSLAHKLQDAKELLLIGPGLAKNHFKAHLEKHHHSNVAKAVVGVENCDHPTEPQMIAIARNFFKAYDQFH